MEVDRSKARAEKARHRANGKIVGVADFGKEENVDLNKAKRAEAGKLITGAEGAEETKKNAKPKKKKDAAKKKKDAAKKKTRKI